MFESLSSISNIKPYTILWYAYSLFLNTIVTHQYDMDISYVKYW